MKLFTAKSVMLLTLLSGCSMSSHTFESMTGFVSGKKYQVCMAFENKKECKEMEFSRKTTLKTAQIGKTDHILSITSKQFPLMRIDDEETKEYVLIYYPDLVILGENGSEKKTFMFNKELYLSARKEFLAYPQTH